MASKPGRTWVIDRPNFQLGEPEMCDRFWSCVSVGPASECWLWKRGRSPKGYGQFAYTPVKYKQVMRRAHRVALMLSGQIVRDHDMVLHACNNPPCCNPNHLRVGTAEDNWADRHGNGMCSGGVPQGSAHGQAKLTEEVVRKMRLRHPDATIKSLADKYGVGRRTASDAIRGVTWKHV